VAFAGPFRAGGSDGAAGGGSGGGSDDANPTATEVYHV
jgi:hypothetical protein